MISALKDGSTLNLRGLTINTMYYIIHFLRVLITCIVQRGIRTPWRSNTHKQRINVLYSLPGEVIFPDGTHRFAFFTCCLDPLGYCYHRGITYKELKEIEEIFKGAIPLDIDDHDDKECSDPEKDTTYDESMASRVTRFYGKK
jgi:hypothetical protein